MQNKIKFFIYSLIFLIFDQITKYLAKTFLMFNLDYEVIKNFFSFTLVYNNGAAFSILSEQRSLLILISLIVLLVLLFNIILSKKNDNNPFQFWGICFLMGGAFGNFLDRVVYGYVVDFLNFQFINFPIFNFADVFINIGGLLLIIYVFTENNERQE